MSDKNHICKWKKSRMEAELDKLRDIVKHPKYICQKCGRVAKAKKWLCKPTTL